MTVRNAGYESTSSDEPRRATSSDPTLVEQRIAAPRDVIVHSDVIVDSRRSHAVAPSSLRAGGRAGSIGAAGAFSVGAAAASVPR